MNAPVRASGSLDDLGTLPKKTSATAAMFFLWRSVVRGQHVPGEPIQSRVYRGNFMVKLLSLPIFLLASVSVMAQDWPQFRGPGGLGLGSGTNLPTQWSDDKNLLWKVKLPGRGASSPIVVGEKIYLTCWSGAVTKKSTAGLTRHLLCFDRTGKLLWQKDFPAPAKDFPFKKYTALHGYASST